MSPKNNFLSLPEAKQQMASFIAAYKPTRSVQRLEIKIHPVDMIDWVSLQEAEVKIYGANQSDTMSIAGIGEAASVTGKRLVSFPKVFKQLRSLLSVEYPYLQWYGGFCFDQRHADQDWNGFGAYRFVLPRFELASQSGRMIFCCNLIGRVNVPGLLKQLDKIVTPSRTAKTSPQAGVLKRRDNPTQSSWKSQIEYILAQNAVQKVVLARKTSLSFKHTPSAWSMLKALKAVTANSYHFAFQFRNICFLGASPERLYRRHQRLIESEALAGTSPKSTDPKLLQHSAKNRREHALVVEAIDEALGLACVGFKRDKQPQILTLPNGHHLITKFQGQLKDGVKDEDILQFLHPTPALGGTPRKNALELIRKLEKFSRGWYGAPVGYVGLDWAEFVVAIRSGLVNGKKLSVFAGAGIVQGSEAQSEWDEVENKISNFIKIIR